MCAKEMSALELKKRGELLVRLGYAIAAGIFSALIGRTGYEAIVTGQLNDYYFAFLIICVLLTYFTVTKGIHFQERANVLLKKTGENPNPPTAADSFALPDDKLVVIDVVNSATKINIRIEKN